MRRRALAGFRSVALSLVLAASACAVGPRYQRPSAPVPAEYKELSPVQAEAAKQLAPAQPKDHAPRGKWWEVFGDPELNALEEQVSVSNLTLAQAEAQFRAAAALAHVARSALFPTVALTPSVTRSSGTTGLATRAPGTAASAVTIYEAPVDLTWEADIFGGARRSVEAGAASAQASAAQLEAVRLAVHAQLASFYFSLHGLDGQKKLLDSTVAADEIALQLTQNRYNQGVVSGLDVAQAKTQLETTRAQATDIEIARSQLEHAIAVLLGKAPADFTAASAPITVQPPEIPAGVPSDLLQRRPDIAAAERLTAAANAQIGVAKAPYFPTVTLSAAGGYASTTLSNLFSLPNRFWSLGASLAETLFDGGRRKAVSAQTWANYDAAVASYRETVLASLQEVEDDLAALRLLAVEAGQQGQAVTAAKRSLELAQNRYKGGITTYLEVVTAQTAAVATERTALDLLTRRMLASVDLLKALGGGWDASALPDRRAVMNAAPPPAAGGGAAR